MARLRESISETGEKETKENADSLDQVLNGR